MEHSKARYPELQDSKEIGLELFRSQYRDVFGENGPSDEDLDRLGWNPDDKTIRLRGMVIGSAVTAEVAILFVRSLTLGWKMLNELEG